MKLRSTLALIFIAGAASGQATLTGASTNPQAGETFIIFGQENPGYPMPGASGANVTWDLHALHADYSDTLAFVNCAGTPECSYFAGSNLAEPESDGQGYLYYSATSSNLQYIGGYYLGSGSDTDHATGEILLQYPCTYNSTFSNSYSDYFHSTAIQEDDYYSGTQTQNCDGYGTLITPSGTFQNVLRLSTVQYEKDSEIYQGTTTIYRDTELSYSWYTPGYHFMLCSIRYYSNGSGSTDTGASYLKAMPNGITEINNETSFDIYPNPTKEMVNIRFSITTTEQVSITITDILGKEVGLVANDTYGAGEHQLSYNISSLPKGLYLVRLRSNACSATKKIEVM